MSSSLMEQYFAPEAHNLINEETGTVCVPVFIRKKGIVWVCIIISLPMHVALFCSVYKY